MKHLVPLTRQPAEASRYDATLGQILTVVAGIFAVLAQTLAGKESASR